MFTSIFCNDNIFSRGINMKNPRKKVKKLFQEYEEQVGKTPATAKTTSDKEETLWGYYVYGVSSYSDSGGCCC